MNSGEQVSDWFLVIGIPVRFQQNSTADHGKVIRFGTFVRNIGFWCDSTQIWHKVWPISSLTALSRLYSALYSARYDRSVSLVSRGREKEPNELVY